MTVDLNQYKDTHKSRDQKELERLKQESEQANEEFNQYLNQQELKWGNMPEGTKAPGFGLELLSKMGEASRARRAYEAQECKISSKSKHKTGTIINFK